MTSHIGQHGRLAADTVDIRMANTRELEFHKYFTVTGDRDWMICCDLDLGVSGGSGRRENGCELGLRDCHFVDLMGFKRCRL